MAEIVLDRVTKRYPDGTEAVRDLNLTIRDGEFMILVGPSGCGKTTTLRMIAGLEEITEGELRIGDEVVNDLTPKQRDIAMVFQSYALYPHMTVARNMGFALRRAGVPKAEIRRRVEEAARLLGIEEHLERKPARLSGGQRQRVAMGRAMVREPGTFLLDEPLSNLDAKLRVQMRAEIARIQRRVGATTVYVTHDQTEAMTLGDRIAVMRDGVLQQVGTPDELYHRPVNLFVAGFIGAPSMNFVPGRVRDGTLQLPFASIPLDGALRARFGAHAAGEELIVGIRPEDFEDASLVHDERHGHVVEAEIDVLEKTGSDIFVHIALDHGDDAVLRAAAAAIVPDDQGTPLPPELVARLSASSRLREGELARLWVDVANLHVFDPRTLERIEVREGARSPVPQPPG